MLEPLRNPASWDNFRKVVVLVLVLWAVVSAVLCIIYFFILGAAPLHRRTYSGRLFWLPRACSQAGGGGRLGQMISARPITVLLRNPTAFGGLCERGTLSDRVTGHWLAHGLCNLSMSYESCESTGLV